MNFAEGLSPVMEVLMKGVRILVARNPSHGYFTDNLRPLLSFLINDDPIRSMNLIVGEHTILKNEPPRSPSFAVIDPLMQNPRDSVPNQVIDLHVYHHWLLLFSQAQSPILAFDTVGVADATTMTMAADVVVGTHERIRFNRVYSGSRERRHGEVSEWNRRGPDRGRLIGNGGDTAERMHKKSM